MTKVLRELWNATVGKVHQRLFRQFFEAMLSRLNTIIDEVSGARAELQTMNARLEALDEHVRTVVAARWEDAAVARRIAALEDKMADESRIAAAEPELGSPRP